MSAVQEKLGRIATEDTSASLHVAKKTRSAEGGKVAFFFLCLFTAVLLIRPSDMLQRPIRIAEPVALIAIVAYLGALLTNRLKFYWSRELGMFLFLSIWFALGVPFAYWRSHSLTILTDTWSKTFIIFFLLTQTVTSFPRLRKLIWTFIASAFIVSAYSLVKGVDVSGSTRYSGATGGFLSGNYVGIAAAMVFPYIFSFLITSRGVLRRIALLATFAMLSWFVVVTASRGGFFSVAFCGLLSYLIIFAGNVRLRVGGLVFLVIICIATAFAPRIFWDRMATLWDSDVAMESADAASATESRWQRQSLLNRSIEYTLDDPVFGVGMGNFAIRSGTETGAQGWLGTHNTFTQVAAEGGIPSFLIFLALLAMSISRVQRIKRDARGEDVKPIQMMARATLVSLLSFAFAGFFAHLAYDYYLYYLVGFSVVLQRIVYGSRNRKPSPAAQPAFVPAELA